MFFAMVRGAVRNAKVKNCKEETSLYVPSLPPNLGQHRFKYQHVERQSIIVSLRMCVKGLL